MKKALIIALLVVFCLNIDSVFAQSRYEDSLALVELYDSTNGDSWTNNSGWKTGHLDTWYGVIVTGGRVSVLNLGNNDLAGSIPSSIGDLTNLDLLNLSSNQLTGTIPSEIGNLANLTDLWLDGNQLTGTIPTQIGALTNLAFLYLRNNQLTGTIPPEIGNLSYLTYLNLSSNQLTGTIPSEIGNLTDLIGLYLNENQLTGTIPAQIGNLTNLTDLWLSDNQLTGSIPPEIENLTNLRYLLLDYNQLTGSIPPEMGDLTNLASLSLSYNQLTGSIPPEVGNLTNLEELGLNSNQFTGTIPAQIGALTNLIWLVLSNNEFTDLPSLSALTSLISLVIQNNKFTFEDIEPNIGVASTFIYSPQDSVGETIDTTVNEGSSFTMSVSVGGDNNQYQWKKNESVIPSATDSSYTISSVTTSDSGSYICEITNTVATKLTLYSRPINVTVNGSAVPESDLPKVYSMNVRGITASNKLKVRYTLPKKSIVNFWLYDVKGAKVEEISEEKPAGFYSRDIDMNDVSKGVYFLKMQANDFTKTGKVVLM